MNQKNIDKSVQIACQLFPQRYENATSHKAFHFAFLWKKNRLISIGQNCADKPCAKALYFAKRFKTKHRIKYPYIHAEINALQKDWGREQIDNSFSLVSLRVSRGCVLRNAKPCRDCQTVLSAIGVDDIWWSDKNGDILCVA